MEMSNEMRIAIQNNNIERIEYLLNNGEPLNYINEYIFNPLDCAIKYNNAFLVNFFIKKGINIHVYNEYALHKACQYGYIDIVKLLIENGADIYKKNTFYNSSIDRAIDNEQDEVIKYLIDKGAELKNYNSISGSVYNIYKPYYRNIRKLVFILDYHFKREILFSQSSISDYNILTIVFDYV